METHESTRVARAALLRGMYAIVNENDRVLEIARAALAAGFHIVQYRAKAGIDNDHLRALRAITHESRALLIINDDWRAAAEFACDGVHLGPDDDGFDDVRRAREALPEGIIGLSCGTVSEMHAARAQDIDYAGVGAVYATASKHDAGAPIGIPGLSRVIAEAHVPVCAIGGIDAVRLPEVVAAGASMAAVIGALATTDSASSARALVDAWNAAR